LAALLAESHLFLHPAIKDPCPNAAFEAICAGLPVIYHPGPGSSAEVIGANGIALDEADPGTAVATARARLGDLQAVVRSNRAYYRVERAAAAYSAVFKRLVGHEPA
jgi:glycosyltransferase involved in cell wall biosynthesis